MSFNDLLLATSLSSRTKSQTGKSPSPLRFHAWTYLLSAVLTLSSGTGIQKGFGVLSGRPPANSVHVFWNRLRTHHRLSHTPWPCGLSLTSQLKGLWLRGYGLAHPMQRIF